MLIEHARINALLEQFQINRQDAANFFMYGDSLNTVLIILLLSCFGAWLAVKIIFDPIKTAAAQMQKISQGHINLRASAEGYDEISQIGKAFNALTDEFEKAQKTRDEFVSDVSHELKTPLSSMKVLSESILHMRDVPEATIKEFLQDINSEIDRMTFIVNDLLTLIKLDMKETKLNSAQTKINEMLLDALKRLLPLAKEKNIRLTFEELKNVTASVDEMKMSLAVSNVIENAIKYTYKGGVVRVTLDADHAFFFVTVTDTGIGIPESEFENIFTRFYRIDKTRDRETGGTGLGLAITRSIALLHNGAVRVASRENEGSTFILRIPL